MIFNSKVFISFIVLIVCFAVSTNSHALAYPSAPVGVTVTASGGQNTITWVPVQGAISYNVYWSTTPKFDIQNASVVTHIISSSFVHNRDISADQIYYYKVTALNEYGESIPSAQVMSVIVSVPKWRVITGLSQTIHFKDVIYGNNLFVAVGSGGSIYTSPDGAIWTSQVSGTTVTLNGVTWSGSQYVVVGKGTVLTSSNGVNWIVRTSPTTNYLSSVAWGNNLFVIVGGDASRGIVYYSNDNGVTWTLCFIANGGSNFYDVKWVNNQFVAVGGDGVTPLLCTSADGITWVQMNAPGSRNSGIAWSGIRYALVGDLGYIKTSTDLKTWSDSINIINNQGQIHPISSLIWTGTQFIGTGNSGIALTSSDGITWSEFFLGTLNTLNGVTASDNAIVIVGDLGTILILKKNH
jgi:hypothetical protein